MRKRRKVLAVRGFMKSGTNWMCNLLNLHPQISCVGEFHWGRVFDQIRKNFKSLDSKKDIEEIRKLVFDKANQLIYDILDFTAEPGTLWIGDRTPAVIEPDILPDAHYFDIRRDGRDILVSRAFHCYRIPDSIPLMKSEPDMAENLRRFQQDKDFFQKNPEKLLENQEFVQRSVRQWERIMSHNLRIKEEHPEMKIMQLRYEDVHVETDKIRFEMYRFLDLNPKDAAPLNDKTSPGFKTESPDKLYRKGATGDWQNYFTDQTKEWFKAVGGETLVQVGYTSDLNW